MQVVSACGNIQQQPYVPFSDDACKLALHLQPGPIPGFDARRLELSYHLAASQATVPSGTEPGLAAPIHQAKKRSATASVTEKGAEGSPMPPTKRTKPISIVHTSYKGQ